MAMSNPYQQYQQQSIYTAGRGELTLMLYNGCIKYIRKSIIAIREKNIPEAHEYNIRAQDIISELMNTLDKQFSVSENLVLLYDYMMRRLFEANLKKDEMMLEEVTDLVSDLRDTWEQALRVTHQK